MIELVLCQKLVFKFDPSTIPTWYRCKKIRNLLAVAVLLVTYGWHTLQTKLDRKQWQIHKFQKAEDSPVIIYRKCTQRTMLFIIKKGDLENKIWGQ